MEARSIKPDNPQKVFIWQSVVKKARSLWQRVQDLASRIFDNTKPLHPLDAIWPVATIPEGKVAAVNLSKGIQKNCKKRKKRKKSHKQLPKNSPMKTWHTTSPSQSTPRNELKPSHQRQPLSREEMTPTDVLYLGLDDSIDALAERFKKERTANKAIGDELFGPGVAPSGASTKLERQLQGLVATEKQDIDETKEVMNQAMETAMQGLNGALEAANGDQAKEEKVITGYQKAVKNIEQANQQSVQGFKEFYQPQIENLKTEAKSAEQKGEKEAEYWARVTAHPKFTMKVPFDKVQQAMTKDHRYDEKKWEIGETPIPDQVERETSGMAWKFLRKGEQTPLTIYSSNSENVTKDDAKEAITAELQSFLTKEELQKYAGLFHQGGLADIVTLATWYFAHADLNLMVGGSPGKKASMLMKRNSSGGLVLVFEEEMLISKLAGDLEPKGRVGIRFTLDVEAQTAVVEASYLGPPERAIRLEQKKAYAQLVDESNDPTTLWMDIFGKGVAPVEALVIYEQRLAKAGQTELVELQQQRDQTYWQRVKAKDKVVITLPFDQVKKEMEVGLRYDYDFSLAGVNLPDQTKTDMERLQWKFREVGQTESVDISTFVDGNEGALKKLEEQLNQLKVPTDQLQECAMWWHQGGISDANGFALRYYTQSEDPFAYYVLSDGAIDGTPNQMSILIEHAEGAISTLKFEKTLLLRETEDGGVLGLIDLKTTVNMQDKTIEIEFSYRELPKS